MPTAAKLKPVPEAVLAKAVLNAAAQLGLNQSELGAVLGLHRTAISRLKQNPSLDAHSKEGEIALLVVRVARALFALTGGDQEWIQHFMRTPNTMTGGVPSQQMARIEGLIKVLQFVDAIRGKV
jgi:hypothetical protein